MTTKTLLKHRRVRIRFMSSIHLKDLGKRLSNTESFKIIILGSLSKNFEWRNNQAWLRKVIYERQGGRCSNSETYLHTYANHYSLTLLTCESLSESGVIKLYDDKLFSYVKIKRTSELIENLKYFWNYWDLKRMHCWEKSKILSRRNIIKGSLMFYVTATNILLSLICD